ncbi:hypothetical protein FSS13T_18890 [Flavobacterium saliperosum S13]|uniref:Glycosyl-4,4'-diaponeurosporenoate acyltransferase n=2 Tax=Flavobacterium saliperosum TaxID=329186 RepID=A0A1G4W7W7_9FLAO|nr:hypothetical protein [Flavobacterium saliperosum]ESU24991.1 hypothetical protein FSS13T_18890 [Flavobacterium saliperosum S13]SCX18245.1 hypothetical protein SAMN02927925_02650 [Flavobacterium saliperosum]
MRKAILICLNLIITILLVYGLVSRIGLQGFLFAWMLNLVLMMCVFFFTETLKSELKSKYYSEKEWERKGKIYESLGVNGFRKVLVWIGWEKLNKKANPVKKNLKALLHLEYRTRQSELGHLIIFFIVTGFTIYVALTFGLLASLWLFILNIVLNLYPIVLQRYNRPRLRRAIALSQYRKERT